MSDPIAKPFGPPWLRRTLVVVACLYIGFVWLDGMGSTLPWKVLPRPLHFFVEVSRLFPDAQPVAIDYRAEGWVCSRGRFEEIDTRDYFQLRPDDKENRYYRFVQFYRHSRPAMQALESYLVDHVNARRDAGDRIGGIRVLSLRVPIPPPGTPIERWHRRPLAEFPENERKNWYWTPKSRRAERCGKEQQELAPEEESP